MRHMHAYAGPIAQAMSFRLAEGGDHSRTGNRLLTKSPYRSSCLTSFLILKNGVLMNAALRVLLDGLAKGAPGVAIKVVDCLNQMVLEGEIERAKVEIQVEFNRNRQLAIKIYEKYREEMNGDVRRIYEDIIGEKR